jgi:hypothetical protein
MASPDSWLSNCDAKEQKIVFAESREHCEQRVDKPHVSYQQADGESNERRKEAKRLTREMEEEASPEKIARNELRSKVEGVLGFGGVVWRPDRPDHLSHSVRSSYT